MAVNFGLELNDLENKLNNEYSLLPEPKITIDLTIDDNQTKTEDSQNIDKVVDSQTKSENNENDKLLNEDAILNEEEKTIKFDIISILKDLLLNDETIQKIGITISKEERDVLLSLLESNPKLFTDIQTTLNKITENNTIDLLDLPDLLLIQKNIIDIIQKLSNIKLNTNTIPETTSNLLKFIIRTLIKENFIVVSNNDEFIDKFDKLIDSVNELITFFNITKPSWFNINWNNLFICK
jgi:hypothetical protein